jgi:hypothetical protein
MDAGEGLDDAGAANTLALDRSQWPAYPTVKFPAENPYSADKALLGKLLFWDEQLSSDNTMACGICHRPGAGGSDPRPAQAGYLGNPGPDGMRGTADDPKASPGIAACMEPPAPDGATTQLNDDSFGHTPQVGRRRAMSVLDAMFWDSMFWDGRSKSALVDPTTHATLIPSGAALEAQALVPVLNARALRMLPHRTAVWPARPRRRRVSRAFVGRRRRRAGHGQAGRLHEPDLPHGHRAQRRPARGSGLAARRCGPGKQPRRPGRGLQQAACAQRALLPEGAKSHGF